MKSWWRRLRAAIGMGLTWGAVWFGAALLVRWPLPDGLNGKNSLAPVGIRPRPNLPRTTNETCSDAVTDMSRSSRPPLRRTLLSQM